MNYSIDSLFFIISNFFLLFYIMKNKKLNFKEKICYFLFFVLLNSSYNIMIKRVHDYNLIIPRTFIYRHKILGPFSILDFFCIFIILKNIKLLFSIIFKNKIIFLSFTRDIVIYIISTISFLLVAGYWLDGGSNFLSASKGFVYSLATLILTFKYMKKSIPLLIPFAIILVNGFLSTLAIDNSLLWVRYGHVVSIIDQEDAYSISIFLIAILFFMGVKFNQNKKCYFSLPYLFLFLLFLFQNMYCVYKTNLILIPLMFIFYYLVINPRFLLLITSFVVPFSCVAFFDYFYNLFTSLAMQTRLGQLTDLVNYLKNFDFSRYIFGLGLGTPYYSTFNTGDLGEIKLIDVGHTSALNYRINIQTPVLSTFKNAGMIGLLVLLFYTIRIWKKIVTELHSITKKYNQLSHYLFCETLACGIYFCVAILNGYTFFGGTLPLVIFSTFCLAKFTINNSVLKEVEVENENSNR